MTERYRAYTRGLLKRWEGALPVPVANVIELYEELSGLASADEALGEAWLERTLHQIDDVREWLARLERGEDS